MKRKLIFVVGPTASGKTAAAIDLALRCGGEVVSADSVAIYRGMDVGSAKPSAQEMRGVPHHMLSCADPRPSPTASRSISRTPCAHRGDLCAGQAAHRLRRDRLYVNALLLSPGFHRLARERGRAPQVAGLLQRKTARTPCTRRCAAWIPSPPAKSTKTTSAA